MDVIAAVIPARGGSKGIPKKNIVPFLGNPLVTYTVEQAGASELVDETFVSTDDEGIADVASAAGATVIDRPAEIAGDEASTESALLHAVEWMRDHSREPDTIVLLQCTSPLRRESDIDETVQLVTERGFDSALSACEDHGFYWERVDGSAEPINYDPQDRKRRQDLDPRYQENGSIYVVERELLETTGGRLGGEIGLHEMPASLSYEIDTPDDLRIVESIGEKVEFYSGSLLD